MAGNIERFLTDPVDVDEIPRGHYAVLGRPMGSGYASGDRMELGTATQTGFEPELQVRFPTGRGGSPAASFLGRRGFSGCAYKLNRPQLGRVRAIVESDDL